MSDEILAITPSEATEMIGCKIRLALTDGNFVDGFMEKPERDFIRIRLNTSDGELAIATVHYRKVEWYISSGRVSIGILPFDKAH